MIHIWFIFSLLIIFILIDILKKENEKKIGKKITNRGVPENPSLILASPIFLLGRISIKAFLIKFWTLKKHTLFHLTCEYITLRTRYYSNMNRWSTLSSDCSILLNPHQNSSTSLPLPPPFIPKSNLLSSRIKFSKINKIQSTTSTRI